MSNKTRFEETEGKNPCNSAFNLKKKTKQFLFTTVLHLHLTGRVLKIKRKRTIILKNPLIEHSSVKYTLE